jgi:hypothetical protein
MGSSVMMNLSLIYLFWGQQTTGTAPARSNVSYLTDKPALCKAERKSPRESMSPFGPVEAPPWRSYLFLPLHFDKLKTGYGFSKGFD